jgi:carbon-monoxide dehydrogenase small subunit
MKITVFVNGSRFEHDVEPRLLLMHYLRDYLGLRSVRIGCDTSNCGACTVLLDGKPVKSCTVFAFMANNRHVTTLEGLHDDVAKAVKRSFPESHALQCSYCTGGFLITIYSSIKNRTKLDHDSVRRAVVGNLCRCRV